MSDIIIVNNVQPDVILESGIGPQGPAGEGIPVGGTTGQILRKSSNTDYATEWVTSSEGGGASWGSITGAIADQSDLSLILSSKANTDSIPTTLADLADDATHRTVTDIEKATWNAAGAGGVASVNGRTGAVTLSASDVSLGNVDNTSDANKPVSTAQQTALNLKANTADLASVATSGLLADLTGDTTHRTVTDAEKTTWSGKQDALGFTAVPNTRTVAGHALSSDVVVSKSDVGLGNVDNTSDANKPISAATVTALAAKADLVDGLIPSSQLPSYVDDVLEYANIAAFPATGESGKIYIAQDTNITYRWSGTGYAEISSSLALGETSATAYRGDRGATAYSHSQATGNPHGLTKSDLSLGNVDNTSDANKPVSTAQAAAIGLKANSEDLATVATSGSYNDLSNKPTIPTALADLTADSTHRTVTDVQIADWDAGGGAGTVDFATAYEVFDHFIGSGISGLGTGASGSGSINYNSTDGYDGVLLLSTGTTASATQGARLTSLASGQMIHMGSTSAKRTIWKLGRNSATFFDGTLTGFILIGFIDTTAADSVDGVYFRVKDGTAIEAVTRSNSTETTTATGVSWGASEWHTFDIRVAASGTSAAFYIDGTLVTTITTNIPTGSGRHTGWGITLIRSSATGTAVTVNADWCYLKITPPSALW